ncbi:MAG: hypothetical protein U5J62_00910 [Desulfurivibrio sp.]|nr:hypothetical protein [Desulfurivibrio sp.]
MENRPPPPAAASICFGLDRRTDEQSLHALLLRLSRPPLLATLIPRLNEQEIAQLVELTGGLLHKHLSHREYHQLFLDDPDESTEPQPPAQD